MVGAKLGRTISRAIINTLEFIEIHMSAGMQMERGRFLEAITCSISISDIGNIELIEWIVIVHRPHKAIGDLE